jgi:hypothetical protein
MKHEQYKMALSYFTILLLAFAATSSLFVGRTLSIRLHSYYFRPQVEQNITSPKIHSPTQASPWIDGKLPVFEKERTSGDVVPSRIHEEMMILPAVLAHSEEGVVKDTILVSDSCYSTDPSMDRLWQDALWWTRRMGRHNLDVCGRSGIFPL